jgi:hypothetical protein
MPRVIFYERLALFIRRRGLSVSRWLSVDGWRLSGLHLLLLLSVLLLHLLSLLLVLLLHLLGSRRIGLLLR